MGTTAARSDVLAPSALEDAVVRSVMYAAVFAYPLSVSQLQSTLVGVAATASDIEACWSSSEYVRCRVGRREGYYFPLGHEHWVRERREREAESRVTLQRHRRLLLALCCVPFTRLVALSGSLAHLNGAASADLDLFVVTAPARTWSVTVAMVALAKLWGQRHVVCVNYVVSERRLSVEPQDLFTANQILHLRPLVGADVYERFVDANPFVARFYPNRTKGGGVLRSKADEAGASSGAELVHPGPWLSAAKRAAEALGRLGPAQLAEWVCRGLYGWYLRRQAGAWPSPDQVRLQPECLKLHTHSHRRRVLRSYEGAVRSTENYEA